MCAILGWSNPKENLLPNMGLFKDMLKLMECRGKDSKGYYFLNHVLLGHNRLSIIDLENGKQPMQYEEYVIVYNGELYNTEEIRQKLIKNGYSFTTFSDTEVLLKAYHCYKEKVLNKIEGIYAFAIYNKKDKSIFLARDRFGVKPLYYMKNNHDFIFSSSIKSILKSERIKPILGKKELEELLSMGPSRKLGNGVFKGIKQIRPGWYMIYKNNKIKLKRYWKLKSKKCNDSFDEAKEKVKELLTDSIIRQTVSDTPIATLLSGGLDSSIITAVVSLNQKEALTTYSIDYEGNEKYFKKNDFQVSMDEYYIDLMSKTFHTNHIYKTISQQQVIDYLKDTLYFRDYPGMIDIDSSLYYFCKEIRKDYKVILSGECADEIFGGYPWFYRDELNDRKSFPWINNIDYRESLLNKDIRKKLHLKRCLNKEYKRTIRELSFKDRKDKYKRLFYVNMTHFMTTLLDRKDRMSMGATLEARVPFADTKLVEYLWNLPFEYKYKNKEEKYLLREAFKDILPKEVCYRKKNPYPKTHNPIFLKKVKELLEDRLLNKNSILHKLFDEEKLKELLYQDQDDLLPWFGQLMTRPQLIAYLYQIDLWVEMYHIQINI